MLLTGELARLTGCCKATIVNYCRDGLLIPVAQDSANRRLFDEGDVERVLEIRKANASKMGNLVRA